jgi:hypothetical protein
MKKGRNSVLTYLSPLLNIRDFRGRKYAAEYQSSAIFFSDDRRYNLLFSVVISSGDN